MKFNAVSKYQETQSQKTAVSKLNNNFINQRFQVLLGITGTGKTFSMAKLIEKLQFQTLILVHNKTLAGQLYSELKELFPNNKVEYFVSNFDYYQPEAYLPEKHLYIDKTSKQNQEINMLRNRTMESLNERNDTIVVASVAAIFGAYDPNSFQKMCYEISVNELYTSRSLSKILVSIGYTRNNIELNPGTFRIKATSLQLMLASTNEKFISIDLFNDKINSITELNYLTKKIIKNYEKYKIFPGNDYVFDSNRIKISVERIKMELKERLNYFKKENKLIEYQRLKERVNSDIDSLQEFGICPGIENYSVHMDLRNKDDIPYTLLDYFNKKWLLIIDESHMMLPQIHAMYNNDHNRKLNLVNYGFRLPSALGNRPLSFNEFMKKIYKGLFVSATPGDYELKLVNEKPVLQIIRPTGLLDPIIKIENKQNQILKAIKIIKQCKIKNERAIILTLTIRSAEEIVEYFEEYNFKSYYLHSELKTIERLLILNNLRKGKLDCVVGINLLREGLDLPEVSTIIILDADAEGFLRNHRSFIQMFGRVCRNKNGTVYLFANQITKSMEKAINETKQRRKIQEKYNKIHNIVPTTIIKPILELPNENNLELLSIKENKLKLSKKKTQKLIDDIKNEMKDAAKNHEFEKAAKLRDILLELDSTILDKK